MSIEEKSLLNDVESYLRGEEPSADVLEKAPHLEEWRPAVERGPGFRYAMTLQGIPFGHPRVPDGKPTTTGAVVWLDRKGRWARTMSRVWTLGQPAGTEIPIDAIDT
ncbi:MULTISPECIES: hypothetical protein [Bradyrhizobium]|uniref:hypothetical protein n=1 Tax=Bradyrhizobium TaxID=374 RepID=UPI001EDBB7B9|nr:hypothetical protein [Bradyrhizobium zhengyangense]MCG2645199.1 hypothetical protein [Bradyrhizobium zhengyangense]